MELSHRFTVPTPLEDTWRSFNQLEEIAPCFPGATLTGVDGDTFTGTVKIKLGPIAMLYAGTGTFLTRDAATHTVVIEAQGKDKRGNGTAGATVTAVLTADGGGGTTVEVSTNMNITGKPAQFGRGVIQDISDKLLEQFVQCVISKAGEPEPVFEPGPTVVEPGPTAPGVPGRDREVGVGLGSETQVSPVVEPPPSAHRTAPHQSAAATELDLGLTMLPVLAKRFGPVVLGALAILGIIVMVCRRKKQ